MMITTFDRYLELCDDLQALPYHADDFCPTPEEVASFKNLTDEEIEYLVWVDETGYRTEENAQSRDFVNRTLRENIKIVEEDEYQEYLTEQTKKEAEEKAKREVEEKVKNEAEEGAACKNEEVAQDIITEEDADSPSSET